MDAFASSLQGFPLLSDQRRDSAMFCRPVGGLVVHEVSSPVLAKMSVDGVLFIVWVTLSLTLTLAVGMMTCLRQFSL